MMTAKMTISTKPAMPADRPTTVASSIFWASFTPNGVAVVGAGQSSAVEHTNIVKYWNQNVWATLKHLVNLLAFWLISAPKTN